MNLLKPGPDALLVNQAESNCETSQLSSFTLHISPKMELRSMGDTTYVQQQARPILSLSCMKLEAIVWRAEHV